MREQGFQFVKESRSDDLVVLSTIENCELTRPEGLGVLGPEAHPIKSNPQSRAHVPHEN